MESQNESFEIAKREKATLSSGRTEAEVVMETIKEITNTVTNAMREAKKVEVESDERIARQNIEAAHKERLSEHRIISRIMLGVLVLGGVGATLSFIFGKPEFGTQITMATLTGVFGYLAGKMHTPEKRDSN